MRGAYRAFAILLIAVLAIVLIINSTSTTGRVVTKLTGDPQCSGLNGYAGKIAVGADVKEVRSPYSQNALDSKNAWLAVNIDACKDAIAEFGQVCGDMFGDCREEQESCKSVNNIVDFNCDTGLQQRCDYSTDGDDYVYSCSIDATDISLGTCTCED